MDKKENEKEKTKISYENLWKAIIRPSKDIYKVEDLGYPEFSFLNRQYIRKDYDLISSEGYSMKCSFFEPELKFRPKKIMPVVIYLHGNSSSRLEGIGMLKEILKRDINYFVFDFPGCGLSEGEYISLGYHESKDLKIIIDFVEKIPGILVLGAESIGFNFCISNPFFFLIVEPTIFKAPSIKKLGSLICCNTISFARILKSAKGESITIALTLSSL